MTERNGKVKTPRSETQARRKMIALRIGEDELAEIQERAKAAGLSVSEYVRLASLGRLHESRSDMEKRLRRLEQFAFGE